ncbi:MAG: UDP-N-acetylglucosamine 1-carboxyvinyltransferase [Bacteroidales bacterium]|jgi:UDP-N-acetylglucosamine 1-carboxyvinyltransferase|nr:UDP-N-acetylglucosamine 1-carboxyvinyltransferase [Bacteroidales bacterium]
MSSFVIHGGRQLKGEIAIQGAKNEALQVIAATLLTAEKVVIDNIPNISDVNNLIALLELIGVEVEKKNGNCYSFRAANIRYDFLKSDDFMQRVQKLRGSVLILGPLLSRIGKIQIPRPGGDKIGRRGLDTHLQGFMKLGATVEYDKKSDVYFLSAKKLQGKYILLKEASVTGTANIVMAAVMAEGTTTLFNAACEPYLVQLCQLLNRMGAKISGVGSNLLTIEGVVELHTAEHRIFPDMIEVGSFIGLAAMTKSEITIKNAGVQHLGLIPDVFQSLGVELKIKGDDIYIPVQNHYSISDNIDGSLLTISDAPWPGFTPDLISIALVTAIQAKGCLLIHQKMFESRLFFVDKLIDMGAKIISCDPHRVTVIGLNHETVLRGVRMSSPDIRAGVALLIAALSAEGESIIENIEQIDRGYENIEERLRNIGADIQRIE